VYPTGPVSGYVWRERLGRSNDVILHPIEYILPNGFA